MDGRRRFLVYITFHCFWIASFSGNALGATWITDPSTEIGNGSCGEAPYVRNSNGADVSPDGATYSCKAGFRISGGRKSIRCLKSGKWSHKPACCPAFGRAPKCSQRPPRVSQAVTSETRGNCGDSVMYKCKAGYTLFGSNQITCEFNEETNTSVWSMKPFCGEHAKYMKLSDTGYVGKMEGTSKLLLSVPHGGYLKADEITARIHRKRGCKINGICLHNITTCTNRPLVCKIHAQQDTYTLEMALEIIHHLKTSYGIVPHVVINLLHRSRLDANRNWTEAPYVYDDVTDRGRKAWLEYETSIQQIKSRIPGGILLDLHGQRMNDWTQLGYALKRHQLNSANLRKPEMSSINNLYQRFHAKTGETFDSLLSGHYSLGYFLQRYAAQTDYVPSPKFPTPKTDERKRRFVFSGGYLTKRHGLHDAHFNAIQIEFPNSTRTASSCKTKHYCKNVAHAISEFYNLHFGPTAPVNF
ncbi:uncharacterized protein LOC141909816 isoform X2 [Tubulanus polymorphus]|uniref:uncharacterized protein LOC141909816 isoform X2 n=1 Tax=Tubulanus polymorphus TaxID=672921 RepID=UPI003DA41D2D